MATDTLTRTWAVSGLTKLQQAVGEVFTVVDLSPLDDRIGTTSTRISQRRHGSLTFTKKEGHAAYAARSARKSPEPDDLCLVFTENGNAEVFTNNKNIVCEAQTLVLMDFAKTIGSVRNSPPHSLISVSIPKSYLQSVYREIDDSCFIVAPSDVGWGAILRDSLYRVWREPEQFNECNFHALAHLFLTLIGNVFIADRGKNYTDKLNILDDYISRINRIIDDHLPDETLSSSFIAKKLSVSSSYIYSILRQRGMTPGQLILDRRIDHCAQILSTPALYDRSITDIAFGAGFKDLSHFSRTFSRRMGKSPRRFRSDIYATLDTDNSPQ